MFDSLLRSLKPFAQEFSHHGKRIFLVGGALRNLLLGREAKDFDFATDARPSEVQGFFRKVLPTGLKHGTVTVLFRGEAYEVTTFRVDGGYSDGRRPDSVEFSTDLEEDLKRRDFTINAMALDLIDGSFHDPHQGERDLRSKTLRAIGDPGHRFDEDALRVLRLFRFAAQLDFQIEPATLEAVPSRREKLAFVSRERVREELSKSIKSARPDLAWGPLHAMGFLADFFPSLSPSALTQQGQRLLVRLPEDLRWSFWLASCCASMPSEWDASLRALRFSKAELAEILCPPRALGLLGSKDPIGVTAKAIVESWGSRDRIPGGIVFLEALQSNGIVADLEPLTLELKKIGDRRAPIFLTDLLIDGKQLSEEGVPPGPRLGACLRHLQRAVWADEGLNSNDVLRSMAREFR